MVITFKKKLHQNPIKHNLNLYIYISIYNLILSTSRKVGYSNYKLKNNFEF